MSKLRIRFLEEGKWMDEPSKPLFDVKAGDEREVGARLARIATDSGKAEFVVAKQPEVEAGPVAKADDAGPVAKAEGKPGRRGRSR